MKQRSTTLEYIEYDTINEFNSADQELIQKAIEAAHKSYSPYSNFPVGTAIRLTTGEIFCGNNQENLSFPAGTCAERSVIHYLKANFPDAVVESIAVTATNSTSEQPVTPCGICRQVIMETENVQNKPIRILLHKIDSCTYEFKTARMLLPFAFEEENLGK